MGKVSVRKAMLAALMVTSLLCVGGTRLHASNAAFVLGTEVARLMNARVYQVLFLSVARSTRAAGSLGAKLSTIEGMGFPKAFAEQLVRDLPKASKIVAACSNAADESIERICATCIKAVREGDTETTEFLLNHISTTNVGLLADRNLRGALKPVIRRLGARLRFLKQSSESAEVCDRCEAFLEELDKFDANQLASIKEADFRSAALRHFGRGGSQQTAR